MIKLSVIIFKSWMLSMSIEESVYCYIRFNFYALRNWGCDLVKWCCVIFNCSYHIFCYVFFLDLSVL